MERRKYPTDLSDEEWGLLGSHLPAPKRRGRPGLHSPREIVNAVFYVLKTGCQWRMLPEDFPPWKTAFHYFGSRRIDGTWERMDHTLRRRLRRKLGRHPEPSAGIVDSQSAKTTGVGGEQRGFDGGKKVRGRKRHILVDTEGLVVEARVHSAKVPDQDGIKRFLEGADAEFPRIGQVWLDAGYRGEGKGGDRVEKELGRSAEVVRHPPKPAPEKVLIEWARLRWSEDGRETDPQALLPPRGFRVLPRRWVVERTFAWISHNRRMAKDHERLCSTGEAFTHTAMTRPMLRRLARA